MNKSNVTLIIASAISAFYMQSALATDTNNWYVSGHYGQGVTNKLDATFGNAKITKAKNVQIFDLAIGRRFELADKDLRVELALAHFDNPKFKAIIQGGKQDKGDKDYIQQKLQANAAFINLYADLIQIKDCTFYLTGGAGLSQNNAGNIEMIGHGNDPSVNGKATLHQGKKQVNFAWNAGAGALYQINQKVALDLNYKFYNLGTFSTLPSKPDAKGLITPGSKSKFRAQSINAGIIVSF
jgi:opacity protein-like surface antigen